MSWRIGRSSKSSEDVKKCVKKMDSWKRIYKQFGKNLNKKCAMQIDELESRKKFYEQSCKYL